MYPIGNEYIQIKIKLAKGHHFINIKSNEKDLEFFRAKLEEYERMFTETLIKPVKQIMGEKNMPIIFLLDSN